MGGYKVMSKLLRANFARLWKSRAFWVCIIFQIFLAAIDFLSAYFISEEKTFVLSRQFFIGSYIMIFLSVFITSFICTDYSCKTIRNKLIVGQTRAAVYFSNFAAALVGSFVIIAAYWAVMSALAFSLGVEMGMPLNEFCFLFWAQIAAVTALVSLYVLLSELVTSKSKAVTAALISSFVLSIVYPAMKEMYIEFNVQAARAVSKGISVFFTDIMPSGQLVQMETGEDIQGIFPIYSLAVAAVSTAVGVLIFRRKDLK